MTLTAASLFDKPAPSALGEASEWTQDVLGGGIATSLCVIAIAILGMMLLAGQLQVRRSLEVILGCFLLLGAGMLASRLQQFGGTAIAEGVSEQIIVPERSQRQLPPSESYIPHAGLSLKRD